MSEKVTTELQHNGGFKGCLEIISFNLYEENKKPQKVQQRPCCKEVRKKRKKTTIDGQVQDEEKDKHIDSNNCAKNIVM